MKKTVQQRAVRLLLCMTVWFSCHTAVCADARPSLSVKHAHYPVSGRSAGELRAQMKKRAPSARDNSLGDAHTQWQVKWRFGLKQVPGGCRAQMANTSVQVTFVMPKWTNPADGSPELREKWSKYLRVLQEHENGHKEHGIHAAEEIESAIARLQPMRSCNEAQRTANTIAEDILDKYRRKDLYYDILTVHGATQGAVFH